MDMGAIVYSFVAFFLAAFSKGVTGLGFSTLCLPLLAIILPSTISIPLVIVPSLCSNVLVMAGAGNVRTAIQRFWPLYLAALPGLAIGLWLLQTVDRQVGQGVLGVVLVGYSLWSLWTQNRSNNHQPSRHACTETQEEPSSAQPENSPKDQAVHLVPQRLRQKTLSRYLTIPTGLTTGILNGLTGSQLMPILPYLLALDLKRDEFVTAINLSFIVSSLFMILGLSRFGLISPSLLGIALLGTLFVALGITLGSRIRRRLDPDGYKRLVLILLLVLGGSLILKAYQ